MHCLGCRTTCVGTGLLLRAPDQDRSKGRVCHYSRPDKKSIPSNSCAQSPGLQEPLRARGPPHPASPKHDSSNSLSTQGKIKTDGVAPVSLMNAARTGGQPEGVVFQQPGYMGLDPRDRQELPDREEENLNKTLTTPPHTPPPTGPS